MLKSLIGRPVMGLKRLVRNDQLVTSVAALVVGLAAAAGAVAFREAIVGLQWLFLGFYHELVASGAREAARWRVVLAPVAGGLVVGAIARWLMPGGRPQGVANVIEASALMAAAPPWRASSAARSSSRARSRGPCSAAASPAPWRPRSTPRSPACSSRWRSWSGITRCRRWRQS
jgi:CIC family chloride channel protein